MSKIIYLHLLLLMLFSVTIAQGQFPDQARWQHPNAAPASHKFAEHGDYPNLCTEYRWNIPLAQWDSTVRTTFAYYPSGLVAEYIIEWHLFSPTWEFIQKSNITYNAQGLEDTEIQSNWNGSAWENQYRYTTTYDAQDHPYTVYKCSWNGAQWDTIDGARYTNTYVFTDKVAEEILDYWNTSTNQWDVNWRTTYHWPNVQGWDSTTRYYRIGNAWDPIDRYVGVAWHDYALKLQIAGQFEAYNGTAWEGVDRYNCSYFQDNNHACIYEEWDNSNWMYSLRDSVWYDAHGHDSVLNEYVWSGGWQWGHGENIDYTYDLQGHTVEVIEDYTDSMGVRTHYERREYGSFFTEAAAQQLQNVTVQAFPNPCTDRLNFRLVLKQPSTVEITLHDMQGRLRAQMVTPAQPSEDIALLISGILENGTYTYQVRTKQGIATGKVVVQR